MRILRDSECYRAYESEFAGVGGSSHVCNSVSESKEHETSYTFDKAEKEWKVTIGQQMPHFVSKLFTVNGECRNQFLGADGQEQKRAAWEIAKAIKTDTTIKSGEVHYSTVMPSRERMLDTKATDDEAPKPKFYISRNEYAMPIGKDLMEDTAEGGAIDKFMSGSAAGGNLQFVTLTNDETSDSKGSACEMTNVHVWGDYCGGSILSEMRIRRWQYRSSCPRSCDSEEKEVCMLRAFMVKDRSMQTDSAVSMTADDLRTSIRKSGQESEYAVFKAICDSSESMSQIIDNLNNFRRTSALCATKPSDTKCLKVIETYTEDQQMCAEGFLGLHIDNLSNLHDFVKVQNMFDCEFPKPGTATDALCANSLKCDSLTTYFSDEGRNYRTGVQDLNGCKELLKVEEKAHMSCIK